LKRDCSSRVSARRYARAAVVPVELPAADRSPARIGLVATPAAAPGVRVRLTWSNPTAPAFVGVGIDRAASACPAGPESFAGTELAVVRATAGAATFDDSDAQEAPGTWCYALRFEAREDDPEPQTVLLQVDGVP
jgi:hypothetical protein